MRAKAYRVITFSGALLFLAIIIIMVSVFSYAYLHAPVFTSSETKKCLLVKPGEHFQEFITTLSQESNLPFPVLFKWTVKLTGKSRQLKVGEYCFSQGATVLEVIHAVTKGDFNRREFTIISGKTYQQLKQALFTSSGFKYELKNKSNQQLAYILKLPRVQFEGEFLPETYRYAYPESDIDLLVQAHNLLLITLYQAWNNRSDGLPYQTPYQALIAASIIEKESAIASDRRLISGVIVNRLKKHMRLQMDPTVIYGLEKMRIEKNGTNNKRHNKIILTKKTLHQDTPYNTYRHWGLPPTPICMPSADAIDAAMHPVQSGYLYFVAKGEGYHQFSKTLVEQKIAIKKYLLNK